MLSTELLDGVRIVTMAQNVPGPLAAARLRQAGAQVTKIEPPAGDPFLALSPAWHAEMHAGIAIERLDLKSESGQARMMVLLGVADVLITSQRPSVDARWPWARHATFAVPATPHASDRLQRPRSGEPRPRPHVSGAGWPSR